MSLLDNSNAITTTTIIINIATEVFNNVVLGASFVEADNYYLARGIKIMLLLLHY